LSLLGERSSSEEVLEHNDNVRRSRNWVRKVRRLSQQLSMDLSKTVNACEKFCLNYAVYFRYQPDPAKCIRLLAEIQAIFDELDSQRKTLEYLAKQCDEFARDVSIGPHDIPSNLESYRKHASYNH
jgi:hypothetical protein